MMRNGLTLDQVETTYLRHLLQKDFEPKMCRKILRKNPERYPQVDNKTHQLLTTRNQQACRKPNKYRRGARKDCAKKNLECVAPQHNHSSSSLACDIDYR